MESSQYELKKDGIMKLSFRTAAVVSALSIVVVAGCVSAPEQGSTVAAKNWQVDNTQSSVNFVTTKAGQAGVGGIGEVQTFKRFSGSLDANGKIDFAIDLASVDTGVEIRDERLRTMLWNVKATPTASFSAKLGAEALKSLDGAVTRDMDVEGTLTMAGQTKPVAAKLRVARLGGNAMMVTTRTPIVVNANDYGLKAGVEAMREVMNLNFLASTAPVSFALVLNEKR
jgi:polyisoprenoid-binding protein YceI